MGRFLIVEDVPVLGLGLAEMARRAREGDRIDLITLDALPQELGSAYLVLLGPTSAEGLPVIGRGPASVPVVVAVDPARVNEWMRPLSVGIDVIWDCTEGRTTLGTAIEAALRRQPFVSDGLGSLLIGQLSDRLDGHDAASVWALTRREREILALLAEGRSNRSIAGELFISENTVKNHVGSILDKLQAASRTEAVALAARAGLVTL